MGKTVERHVKPALILSVSEHMKVLCIVLDTPCTSDQGRIHGCTPGVDMSTPLFPEGVSGIYANLASFLIRGVLGRSGPLGPTGGSASRSPLEARSVVRSHILDLATPLLQTILKKFNHFFQKLSRHKFSSQSVYGFLLIPLTFRHTKHSRVTSQTDRSSTVVKVVM